MAWAEWKIRRSGGREIQLAENGLIEGLRRRLAGRTKRELIEGMISRSPHETASEKLVTALEVYPILLLMLAHDYPTKIWVLDKEEKPLSAGIVTERMRRRRWNGDRITIDECEGITDVGPGYIGIVVSRNRGVMANAACHAS